MRQARGARERLAAGAAFRCRSTSACATGIRSSPTRWRRCRAPASAGRSGSSPRRSAATRAARSTRRTSPRARAAIASAGCADVEVIYVGDWHEHPGLHRSQRGACRATRSRRCRRRCRTAPSWCSPRTASRSAWRSAIPYRAQFEETARWSRPRERSARRRRAARSRSSTRAAAAGRKTRGSGRTSATTCARRARHSRPRCSAPSASSSITSRSSTTSTSRRRGRRRDRPDACHAPKRSAIIPRSCDMLADDVIRRPYRALRRAGRAAAAWTPPRPESLTRGSCHPVLTSLTRDTV